jgi:hypothetical protein
MLLDDFRRSLLRTFDQELTQGLSCQGSGSLEKVYLFARHASFKPQVAPLVWRFNCIRHGFTSMWHWLINVRHLYDESS